MRLIFSTVGLLMVLGFFGCNSDEPISLCEEKYPARQLEFEADSVYSAAFFDKSIKLFNCYGDNDYYEYEIIDGEGLIFSYYFRYQNDNLDDDLLFEELLFELPEANDSFLINSENFCNQNVYFRSAGSFDNRLELHEGAGCIYGERNDDYYLVNVNIPVINISTKKVEQIRFSKEFYFRRK